MNGGDDLAEDFILDHDLVVLSDGEDYEAVFSDNGPSEDNTTPGSPSPTEITQKKRKRREKEKERKAKVSFLYSIYPHES
jgi:hypothetical protein